ncbi:MAG: CDP-alcohol phosphatidyltransferase family protein [Jatrophihabitans sp.]|uniref:CDP-alcohol phosphatidyltransferase family protein n=1 Tax=Jatrophihabitans sp. TaxID=1932789 RepID=UPI003F810A8C
MTAAPAHTTTTYHPPKDATRYERGRAWAVHGFTTLGIVAAMLALRDVIVGRPSYAIIWLLLTLLIDGVDGPIARALQVETLVPRIDGFLLDLIIDFVTCAIVPAAFMYAFNVVPQNNWGIAVLCLMVFTSAIWFARKDMMTEEFWFRGFPAAWNVVGPVLFFLLPAANDDAKTSTGAIITVVLSLLQLTNMPWPHIARSRFARPFTIVGTLCWVGGLAIGAFLYPHRYEFVRIMLVVGSAYFVTLAAVRAWHDHQRRRTIEG